MPQLSFHPGFSGVLLLVVAGVAMVLVALFYARAFAYLRTIEWTQLYLLRLAAIAIVLLLLFRPMLSFQREVTERRSIVFLVDTSASMSIADEAAGSTRLDHARSKVQQWWTALRKDFDLRLVTFADSAQVREGVEQVADLVADGPSTSLSRALSVASRQAPPGKTEAVFLVSDGLHNSAGNPADVAARLGVPIYAVGVGNSLRDQASSRDIRVTEVSCADQLAVKNRAQVKALVDAVGFVGRVVTVSLLEDDRAIAQQQLVLDGIEGAQETVFEFIPEVKGLHTYTARIEPTPDEKIPQNNERSTTALVVDSRIRVLYVEGTLRAEYGALVGRFLTKDPNLEFCALVQSRPNVFTQRTNIEALNLTNIPDDPEQLKTFNVFLLGDLDATYFQGGRMEAIRDRVKDGAGLLMMGGYHSLGPGGFGGSPIEEILPVRTGDREIGQVTDPFLPTLTPDGRAHPIFTNIRQFFPTGTGEAEVSGLPPLEGCARILGAKPGATILATHPTERIESGAMPVVIVQAVGKGRAAVFTGDTTRNWQQALKSLDRESPFLRFWGQMVRWLAGRSDQFQTEAGIAATTDKAYYEPESKVVVTATVRGKEGEAAEGARVIAQVKGPGSGDQPFELTPVAGPAGNFRGEFEPTGSGRFEIVVTADWKGEKLTADKLTLDVGRPNLEFDRLDLDERTLTQLADVTRGRYAHISTADRMVDALERRQERRRVEYELPLASGIALWPLFVLALSLEWLLRRRYHLR